MTDDADHDEHADPDPPGLAKWLTVPGRLLLILTFILGGAGFYFFAMNTLPSLPSGSYPVMFWVAPVVLACVIFFFAVAWVLERAGVRVYQKKRQP